MQYDLIIIGGGAAGMMAAVSARRHHPDISIAIIDRTFALGRKILVCGAGRCNITNLHLHDQIETRYYGAPIDFIEPVFDQFGYQEIVEFFNELGIELYVERKTDIGKLFPVTNQASTVSELLLDEIIRGKISLHLNTEVSRITKTVAGFELDTRVYDPETKEISDAQFTAGKLILSAGGKTYPALGSNGTGYALAESLGHKLVFPVPSALPLEAKNPLSQLLQGVRFDVEVTSIIDGQVIKTRTDDVMFTKYGLSGPAILNISREISIHINREGKNNAKVRLNFFPGKTREQVSVFLHERWEKRPTQTIVKSLFGIFPNKLAAAVLQVLDIDPEVQTLQLPAEKAFELIDLLSGYEIEVTATRGWNEAEFTAGGIESSEVDTPAMTSKIVPDLYFAGEILNVDGDVGGFNLSWSWSSGWAAGKLGKE